MLYLAIDQHRKQLTVNLRDEAGREVLKRQVSTEWQRARGFFASLQEQAEDAGGYVAIVEVCGFNDWLLKLLPEYGCREVVLVQPAQRGRRKTDKRDADKLGELLWVNRARLARGEKLQHLRRVSIASPQDAEDRQLTMLRKRLGEGRTQTINRIQHILLRHNLQQDCPTRTLQTKTARRWLEQLALGEIDRLELDLLLKQWALWDQEIEEVNQKIAERQAAHPAARIIATIPGARGYTALALASRIGDVRRFARPSSLANYWGLAPGCRNSGEATQRPGSITKEGSRLARFLLGQMVLHVLRKDRQMKQWYQRIKRRRGAKIARVAVMRRLATILWHMLTRQEAYRFEWTAPAAAPRGVAGTLRESPPRPLAAVDA